MTTIFMTNDTVQHALMDHLVVRHSERDDTTADPWDNGDGIRIGVGVINARHRIDAPRE